MPEATVIAVCARQLTCNLPGRNSFSEADQRGGSNHHKHVVDLGHEDKWKTIGTCRPFPALTQVGQGGSVGVCGEVAG